MRNSLFMIIAGLLTATIFSACDQEFVPDYNAKRRALLSKTQGKKVQTVQWVNSEQYSVTFVFDDGAILTIGMGQRQPDLTYTDSKETLTQR